jgi:hypothetical protein
MAIVIPARFCAETARLTRAADADDYDPGGVITNPRTPRLTRS